MTFWETVRGANLADTITRELPKLVKALQHDYSGYVIKTKVFGDLNESLEFINHHKNDIIKLEHVYRDCYLKTIVTYKEPENMAVKGRNPDENSFFN